MSLLRNLYLFLRRTFLSVSYASLSVVVNDIFLLKRTKLRTSSTTAVSNHPCFDERMKAMANFEKPKDLDFRENKASFLFEE